VVDQAAAKSAQPPRDLPADVSEADNPHRLTYVATQYVRSVYFIWRIPK
jgi:hypothetical protein